MAIVVRDMNKTIEYYKSLGINTFQPEFVSDSSTYTYYKVHDKTPDTIDKTKFKILQIGSFLLEFVQPIEGEPIYKEFLKSRGEAIHHIAFNVDNLEEEVAKLQDKGIMVIAMAKTQTGGFAYFDINKDGSIVIELMQRKK